MPTENVRFSQTYVDARTGADGKPLCSAIIALLVDDPTVFSDMHRLPTDELWHFYLGDPIELLLLYSDGSDELVILRSRRSRRATRYRPSSRRNVHGRPASAGRRLRGLRKHHGARLCLERL